MRIIFVSLIILSAISKSAFCQDIPNNLHRHPELVEWSQAAVNIECRGDKYAPFQIQVMAEKKRINNRQNKYIPFLDSMQRLKNVFYGTAVYVADGDKRYMITAKHVVYDEASTLQNAWNQRDTARGNRRKYEAIYEFAVKTPYDMYLRRERSGKSSWTSAINNKVYVLSSDRQDIAVISLQGIGMKDVRRSLDSAQCIPIPISKIDTSNDDQIGDDVYAIGYPSLSSITEFQEEAASQYTPPSPVIEGAFQSKDIVLPMYVWGKISMEHPKLDYFIADLDGYPGNSGGPLVREGKMIGIISGQILVPIFVRPGDKNPSRINNLYSRGNLMHICKPHLIMQYIRELQEREKSKGTFY